MGGRGGVGDAKSLCVILSLCYSSCEKELLGGGGLGTEGEFEDDSSRICGLSRDQQSIWTKTIKKRYESYEVPCSCSLGKPVNILFSVQEPEN